MVGVKFMAGFGGNTGGLGVDIGRKNGDSSIDRPYFKPDNAIAGLTLMGFGAISMAVSRIPNLPNSIRFMTFCGGAVTTLVGADRIVNEVRDEIEGRR